MSTITTGKVIIYKPNFNVNPVDTLLDLPVLGAENTLYVIKDTGAIYLWNGSEFIIYDSRPYKVYTALLTQSGTDAPVATVLENTLGGVPVWSYISTGTYRMTLTSAFTADKTNIEKQVVVWSDSAVVNDDSYYTLNKIGTSIIELLYFFSGAKVDNELNIPYIEIRV